MEKKEVKRNVRRFVAPPEHILTFISEAYRFIDRNGITTTLKVDKDNSVENLDVLDITHDNHPAAIIADMQNVCATMLDTLEEYYQHTGNKAATKRLIRLREKYKNV